MKTLAALGVVLAMAAGTGPAMETTPGEQSPDGVRWGGAEFFAPGELSDWLRGRGLNYQTWAGNHPGAAARLERPAEPELTTTIADVGPLSPPEGAATVSEPASRDLSEWLLIAGLGGLASALLVLASLPALHLRRANVPLVLVEHQPHLAGAGLAVGVALFAAYLI